MRASRRIGLALTLACGLSFVAVGAAAQALPSWAASSGVGQPDNLGPGGPPPPPPPPTPIPVDGGLGLLALAGTAFLGHRLRIRSRAA